MSQSQWDGSGSSTKDTAVTGCWLKSEITCHVQINNSFADGKGMKNLESFLIKAFRMFSDVTCEEETRLASLSKY